MICEFLKKIFDYIIFFITTFLNALIPDLSPKNKEYINKIIKGQILYTKTDTLLRKEPNSSSDLITIINKGNKVEYLNETIIKDDGTKYDKVKLLKNKLYQLEEIGFVLRSQLSDTIINEDENSISIKSKIKIIKEAYNILNSKTAFSMEYPKRLGGFENIKYDDKYYFDCSSFCSCILNRTFNFPPPQENKDKKEIKAWSTYMYLENIQKKDSIFNVVQEIYVEGKVIDLNKLQIGDCILGQSSNINNGMNHIMLYVGEGYIIHCTKGRYLGIKTNKMRDGVVKESLIGINYYTELENLQNIKNGNITKRFDVRILVLRYKEKKEE